MHDSASTKQPHLTTDGCEEARNQGKSHGCEEIVAAPTALAGFDWFLFGAAGEYLGAIHAPSLRPVIGRHAPTFLLGGRPTAPIVYSRPAA